SCSPDEKQVRLWDTRAGQEVRSLPCTAFKAAFSPDGRHLATAGGNAFRAGDPGELRLWDVATGQELLAFRGHTRLVNSVAFSSDGRLLGSSSADPRTPQSGEVIVWEVATGKQLFAVPQKEPYATTVAFSPDSKTLAFGELGGTVQLHAVATGQSVRTL